MKTTALVLIAAVALLVSGCVTYEKIENGERSGFSTDPRWYFQGD
jgi:outer membrane murein-binding lipoprotein Lpp